MKQLKLDCEALAVDSFPTAEPGREAGVVAPTYPPYCDTYYTHCRCTPRADEP
ncbi:MAG: hypothetical protein ACJ8GN_00900 [Longimicrobiaceae bacterium]